MSKFYFKFSPMEAGKSAMLLIEAYNFEKRNINILCMKPSIDNRESIDKISSRIGIEKECFVIYPNYDIYAIVKKIISLNENNNKLQWILVDESQFLTSEQVEQFRAIVDDFDINVMCYGLRTDFKSRLFPGSKRLFELADTIEEIKSTCECGSKTIINARVDKDGNVLKNGPQTLVGGDDRYISICRKCWKRSI